MMFTKIKLVMVYKK